MKYRVRHSGNIILQIATSISSKSRGKPTRKNGQTKQFAPNSSLVGQIQGQSSAKWHTLVQNWKRSNHPNPTYMLTINFSRPKLDEHLKMSGKSVSSFKARYIDQLRRIYQRNELPLLAAWVIEVRNLPHIHILIWIPNRRLRLQIIQWLERSFPHDIDETGKKRGKNSGAPAVLTKLSEKKIHKKTGRRGLDGMEDYLAKEIEKNAQRKSGRNIGRIYGQTNELSRVGLDLNVESGGVRHD